MFKTPLSRFRLIALVEGISFLLLLFIAMPLKYFADMPLAVSIAGYIHGILFLLYIAALAHVYFVNQWKWKRAFGALIASVIPFANFVLDRHLRREEEQLMAQQNAAEV